jgi:hypothetical protein
MIKMLEDVIEKVRTLPEDQQVVAAELLETLLAQQGDDEDFTPAQIEGIRLAQEQVRRGEIATEEEVAAVFRRFGVK